MELDLICPRLPRLIWAPFGTLNHILSKLESHTAQSGCYGILSYNNLTSRWRKTAFICWLTENVRSLIYAFSHILSLLKLAFSFFPTNWVCIMSLFFWFNFVYIMLLSACICFAFLLLKINCRRNLIQCLDLLELSYDSRDHLFVNDTFFLWIVIIIVGGECFIRSNWGQPFCHKWAHIKARREEKLLGLKVMLQLKWKHDKNHPHTFSFPASVGWSLKMWNPNQFVLWY